MRWVLSSDNFLNRCQRAGWKEHKNSCRGEKGQGQQLSLEAIRRRVCDAQSSEDWDAILRWESRIEELVAGHDHWTILDVLQAFAIAYETRKQLDKAGLMWVRCAEALGALKHFSGQVEMLRRAGETFMSAGDYKNACVWLENARDVSKEQGFVSMESRMCSQLGEAYSQAGGYSEELQQYRRAWAVAKSIGEDDASHDRASLERAALRSLVKALCSTGEHVEAEALFTRLREGGDSSADCRLKNHNLRGMMHSCHGNYEAAAEAFQAAVDVAETETAVLEDLQHESSAEHSASLSYALRGAKAGLEQCGVGAGGAPPLPSIGNMVLQARDARDWPGVLRWESRLEELLTFQESGQTRMILAFACANFNQGHFAEAASLYQRRVQVLGKLERFTEQGHDMCLVGDCFLRLNNSEGAEMWYQKARRLGEKLGCYESECRACLGLGKVAKFLDRMQEAEESLRNALTALKLMAVEFVEGEGKTLERDITKELALVLLQTEEAGPLIQRLRELAERAGADPLDMVKALQLAVGVQLMRGERARARTELQVLPSDRSSSCARFSEPGSHLPPSPQAPTRSGRRTPSVVHLLRNNPRRSVGAA